MILTRMCSPGTRDHIESSALILWTSFPEVIFCHVDDSWMLTSSEVACICTFTCRISKRRISNAVPISTAVIFGETKNQSLRSSLPVTIRKGTHGRLCCAILQYDKLAWQNPQCVWRSCIAMLQSVHKVDSAARRCPTAKSHDKVARALLALGN